MTAKHDVLVMSRLRPLAMAQLEEAYTLHRHDEAGDKPSFLRERGPLCSAVVTQGHCPLTGEELEHLPRLGFVGCGTAGFDAIDAEALRSRGIHLTATSAALRDEVADTALMLTLAACRELVSAHEYVRSGEWARNGMYPLLSTISGKRAGILGLGAIGQSIARRLEPIGVEIGYSARGEKPVGHRYLPEPLDLCEWSDILIVAVPGGQETAGMVDARALAALGPQGILVNVSRGTVVDEAALVKALKSGALGHAALDVFLSEPDPDPELTGLPNVTLYPHHASGTVETRDAMSQLVVDNLAAFFAGEPLLTPVYDLPEGCASQT